VHADFGFGLKDNDFSACLRQGTANSETYNACANYDAIKLISHSWILL